MSRSFRKTPVMGLCSDSDKPGKVASSRRARRAETALMAQLAGDEDADEGKLDRRLYGSPWTFPKDGKQWIGPDWGEMWKWMGK